MTESELGILTFNVRGIRDMTKQRSIFRFLHVHFPNSIVIAQETHSTNKDEKYWKNEWGGEVHYSHRPAALERGVAALTPEDLRVT